MFNYWKCNQWKRAITLGCGLIYFSKKWIKIEIYYQISNRDVYYLIDAISNNGLNAISNFVVKRNNTDLLLVHRNSIGAPQHCISKLQHTSVEQQFSTHAFATSSSNPHTSQKRRWPCISSPQFILYHPKMLSIKIR